MTDVIKNGDRCKVTFFAEYRGAEIDLSKITEVHGRNFPLTSRTDVQVEKVPEPVETFGPGDVVRSKGISGFTYAIARNGYLDLHNGIWNPYEAKFTSKDFERISLD